jgi:hypothetical protein
MNTSIEAETNHKDASIDHEPETNHKDASIVIGYH